MTTEGTKGRRPRDMDFAKQRHLATLARRRDWLAVRTDIREEQGQATTKDELELLALDWVLKELGYVPEKR